MSKIKSATKKKWLSLQFDRRAAPDEKPHGNRKDVARGKQRTHKEQRRVVHQVLDALDGHPHEDDAAAAEFLSKIKDRLKQLKAPKKEAGVPLARAIAAKAERRKRGTS